MFYRCEHGPGGGSGHEPRQFSFLPFCLANVAFSPSLPRFLYPSLTRTKPICSETRVTGGVDKPCSCTLPRDAPPPPHPLLFFRSFHSTLSFSTQLPRPYRGGDVGAPALRNLIPVTRPRGYNALAPHGVMVLYLRSSPPGFRSSFPTAECIFHANHGGEEAAIGKQ